MPAAKLDARWSEAALFTVGLWLFMLMIFLPAIFARHANDGWSSIALDCATIVISIGFGLGLFALFRATLLWPNMSRLVIMAIAVLVASALQITSDLIYTAWVAENLRASWRSVPIDLARAAGSMLNYVCVFTVNVAIFQMTFSRRRSLTRERALAAAESAAQRAQLEALRLQLNPHFLFNTLNAISSLILTKRNEQAEQMTDKLSSFLRASLACDPSELVPIEEELELTAEYLEIETIRFGDRLRVDISCAPAARDLLVPGMLIQPLVENAVKYGVARSAEPVAIRIAADLDGDVLCLSVADDGTGSDSSAKAISTGVGLNNVRRRLASLYGNDASLSVEQLDPGFLARICIPVSHVAFGR